MRYMIIAAFIPDVNDRAFRRYWVIVPRGLNDRKC